MINNEFIVYYKDEPTFCSMKFSNERKPYLFSFGCLEYQLIQSSTANHSMFDTKCH